MAAFKKEIKQRRETPVAIFHKFRTGAKDLSAVHVFVEGYEDSIFYDRILSSVDNNGTSNWKFHICFGKFNMDEIIKLFYSSKFSSSNSLFIRDSDFDAFLRNLPAGDKVFITCGYSVENYVCDTDTIVKFMRTSFGLDATEVDIAAEAAIHAKNIDTLFKWLSPVIGAILEAIQERLKLDLNQVNLEQYYKILYSGNRLPARIPKALWKNVGLEERHFNDESLARGSTFSSSDALAWLRGKYVLECTSIFLSLKFAEYYEKHKARSITRFHRKANSDFSANSVFERLSACSVGSTKLRSRLVELLKGTEAGSATASET
ncbi:DUF4435 domain-containing protein [Roseomonas elaeocarpi]|uniref:DUF4435 domain-containing protein n=1 Tax=Roseomonas elaeocarpi TaxID=907779 RepID=A0ABV6JVD9_9PROT